MVALAFLEFQTASMVILAVRLSSRRPKQEAAAFPLARKPLPRGMRSTTMQRRKHARHKRSGARTGDTIRGDVSARAANHGARRAHRLARKGRSRQRCCARTSAVMAALPRKRHQRKNPPSEFLPPCCRPIATRNMASSTGQPVECGNSSDAGTRAEPSTVTLMTTPQRRMPRRRARCPNARRSSLLPRAPGARQSKRASVETAREDHGPEQDRGQRKVDRVTTPHVRPHHSRSSSRPALRKRLRDAMGTLAAAPCARLTPAPQPTGSPEPAKSPQCTV